MLTHLRVGHLTSLGAGGDAVNYPHSDWCIDKSRTVTSSAGGLWLIGYVDDSGQRQIRDFGYMTKSHMIEMTKSLDSSALSRGGSCRGNGFTRTSSVCSL